MVYVVETVLTVHDIDTTTLLSKVGKWLTGATDRGGGRARRFAEAANQ